jgi:hypothetical protein
MDTRRRRFQATVLGVISVERQSRVREVVARKALMLF